MHFAKYKLSGLTNMFRHYTREYIQEDGHIDKSRTKDNIYLEGSIRPEDGSCKQLNKALQENIKERTEGKTMRKDAVVMVDLIITQPKQLGKEYNEQFFKTMNEFCRKHLGGEDNQIYSVVHLDEATPHLHYSFIPFVKENEKEKLCCKEILTRKFLKEFHKMAEKETGYQLTNTEDDRKKDLSLADYKKLKEMQNQILELDKEIIEKKNEMQILDNEYNESKKEYQMLVKINENSKTLEEIKNEYKLKKEPQTIETKSQGINIPPQPKKSFIEQMDAILSMDFNAPEKKIEKLEDIYFIKKFCDYDLQKIKNEKIEVKQKYQIDDFIKKAKEKFLKLQKAQNIEPKNILKKNLTR